MPFESRQSKSLPPDIQSLKQALLRVHYQMYSWLRYNLLVIEELNMEEYGWQVDSENDLVTPLWFTGPQLPPSMELRISKDDHIQIEPANKQPRLDDNADMECDDATDIRMEYDSSDIDLEIEYIYFGDSDEDVYGDLSDYDYEDYI